MTSMNRRENCWADLGFFHHAVAGSFISSLKKARIKRHIYTTRQDVKSDVFEYIEGFYHRVQRHSHLDQLSPLAFEQLLTVSQKLSTEAGEVQFILRQNGVSPVSERVTKA